MKTFRNTIGFVLTFLVLTALLAAWLVTWPLAWLHARAGALLSVDA